MAYNEFTLEVIEETFELKKNQFLISKYHTDKSYLMAFRNLTKG